MRIFLIRFSLLVAAGGGILGMILLLPWGGSGPGAGRRGASANSTRFLPQRAVQSFPPITTFPVKPVGEAKAALTPADLVLGVTINGQSRAYSINMLTGPQREILNDDLGGQAIAATW